MTTSPVPPTLQEWTYEAVERLCAAGQCESDRHDFKFDVRGLKDPTKICCAFANTFGGFVVLGVKDGAPQKFEPIGLDPDKEVYGIFRAKVQADPEIAISFPGTIAVPGSSRLLYVFEVPQSVRRPHLPTPADKRVFWKRQGSDCVQMTLEEIRYQMNSYEEKREKLALLLVDLFHKERALEHQASLANDNYTGDVFTFDVIDRVVVEAYAFLKDDINTIGALDTIRRQLSLLNLEKQRMSAVLAMSYDQGYKNRMINHVRDTAKRALPGVSALVEQIERSIFEKFAIRSPYKLSGARTSP